MRTTEITLVVSVAVSCLLGGGNTAVAQADLPVAIEGRVGLTRPITCVLWCDSRDRGEGAARVWEGSLEVQVTPVLALYGTYSDYKLQKSRDHTDTGSGFGMGGRLAFGRERIVSPWVRGGAILHRRTFVFLSPSEPKEVRSAYGWGWEGGVGLSVRLGQQIALTPAIRFQRYAADVNDAEWSNGTVTGSSPRETNLLLFDLGLRFMFSGQSDQASPGPR